MLWSCHQGIAIQVKINTEYCIIRVQLTLKKEEALNLSCILFFIIFVISELSTGRTDLDDSFYLKSGASGVILF